LKDNMKIFELLKDLILPENDCILTENNLFEMANIKPKESGLPLVIFASTKYDMHAARIKVSNIPNTFSKDDNFVITISKTPKIVAGKPKYNQQQINDIYDWILLNYDTLMKFWKDEYDSNIDFYNDLKKI
jgi:hypothetical protein